jgi:hypothetical protein
MSNSMDLTSVSTLSGAPLPDANVGRPTDDRSLRERESSREAGDPPCNGGLSPRAISSRSEAGSHSVSDSPSTDLFPAPVVTSSGDNLPSTSEPPTGTSGSAGWSRGVGAPASRDDQLSFRERSSVLEHNPFRGASCRDTPPCNGGSPETTPVQNGKPRRDGLPGINYQEALTQVRCLDLIYFKNRSSSINDAADSTPEFSHVGMIVNSQLLPSVPGMKSGCYYVLQTHLSSAKQTSFPETILDKDSTELPISGNGSVAPAPGSNNEVIESNNESVKYYGVHLTELGTVMKRYTTQDSSPGVAWAKLKSNPLIQGANESSTKFKKRKKSLISQIDQFYQKSKTRNLGRKIFGLMRKSTKRPDGLKFSHHLLHTGSTYNAYRYNWSTYPIQEFYQHLGVLPRDLDLGSAKMGLGWLVIPPESSQVSNPVSPSQGVESFDSYKVRQPNPDSGTAVWSLATLERGSSDVASESLNVDDSPIQTTDPSSSVSADPSSVTVDPQNTLAGSESRKIIGSVDNLNSIVADPIDDIE